MTEEKHEFNEFWECMEEIELAWEMLPRKYQFSKSIKKRCVRNAEKLKKINYWRPKATSLLKKIIDQNKEKTG